MSLNIQIDRVDSKVQAVLDKYSKLNGENKNLHEKSVHLEKELNNARDHIKELENQLNFAKLAKNVTLESGDEKQLKLKINEAIREIDKCISLLNV